MCTAFLALNANGNKDLQAEKRQCVDFRRVRCETEMTTFLAEIAFQPDVLATRTNLLLEIKFVKIQSWKNGSRIVKRQIWCTTDTRSIRVVNFKNRYIFTIILQ